MVGGHGPGESLWPGPHCAGSIAFTVRQPVYVAGRRRHYQVPSRRYLFRRARRRFASGYGCAHGTGVSRSAAGRELLQQVLGMEPWKDGGGR